MFLISHELPQKSYHGVNTVICKQPSQIIMLRHAYSWLGIFKALKHLFKIKPIIWRMFV